MDQSAVKTMLRTVLTVIARTSQSQLAILHRDLEVGINLLAEFALGNSFTVTTSPDTFTVTLKQGLLWEPYLFLT